MKYLGIDYGAKNVGLAVSDAEHGIAFPRASIPNDQALVPFITQMVLHEGVERIIMGDTKSSGGKDNPVTAQASRFIQEIARETGVPVDSVPEIWSSIEASRFAPKGSEHNDAVAAAIILQRYIDMHQGESLE